MCYLNTVPCRDIHARPLFFTAASAVAELNDTNLNGVTIHVRYFEPGNQADFRLVHHSDVKKPSVPDQEPPLVRFMLNSELGRS